MALEIHRIERLGEGGTVVTNGGIDFGHRDGGGGGGSGSVTWSQILNKPAFASVAFSGSYNDLLNKPAIPAAYDDSALVARVTALENSGGGGGGTPYDDTAIKARMTAAENKLNGLATVATSGSYNDLTNKPTLFSGNYNDLTNKPTIPAAYNDSALVARVAALEGKTDADTLPVLEQALTTTQTVGSIASGTTFPVGTSLESILRALLAPAVTPPGPTPSTGLPVFATVSSLTSLDQIDIDYSQSEYIQNVPAQTETNPIIIEVPTEKNFVLTIWNPLLNQWVDSTNKWDVSSVTRTVEGNTVPYTRYTENCECDSGATRVRFTWS